MAFEKTKALNILNYWHRVEFFSVVSLKDLENSKPGVIHYSSQDLLENPNCLPWLDRKSIYKAGRKYSPEKHYNYTIYLGVFETKEFFGKIKSFLDRESEIEWDERKKDEGLTCTLSICLNSNGRLMMDTLQLSTAPWALGQLLNNNIDDVCFDDFSRESYQFREKVERLDKFASSVKDYLDIPQVTTSFEIIEILKLLGGLVKFNPDLQTVPSIIIKLSEVKDKSKPEQIKFIDNDTFKRLKHDSLKLIANEDLDKKERNKNQEGGSKESSSNTDDPVSILNSFFLRDLERARILIRNERLESNSPLIKYLSSKENRLPDLLSAEGEHIICDAVSLPNTPLGRWHSSSQYSMSLMQQFAINNINRELKDGGLYSVNGPPGTGKTTMLRDLVANNIVNRARVLAHLSKSTAAFQNKKLTFTVGEKIYENVRCLIPELSGYEMVVVSNNNSAVENISKELPQSKSIGDEFGNVEYFKSVAQKIAAEVDNKTIFPLDSNNDCWGLVGVALGKVKNRETFSQKIHFSKIESLHHFDSETESYSTLVPAIKKLIKSCSDVENSFKIAQKEFIKAEKDVVDCYKEISKLEKIAKDRVQEKEFSHEIDFLNEQMLDLELFLADLRREKVSNFRFIKWIRRFLSIRKTKQELSYRKIKHKSIEAKLKRLKKNIDESLEDSKHFLHKHDGVLFCSEVKNLNKNETQRTTFGHSKALNFARSNLTVKAFNLHQAWLVASYERGFSKNVNLFTYLIQGKINEYEYAKYMWQCFFLVVPVISSTFASVASQFSSLHEGDIGWLFIDEAGQATPQQAVGAIMRSRRVVVVGDPLQVEPVLSTPPALLEVLGKNLLKEEWFKWCPSFASVQTVADRVNPYGTGLISQNLWLGSPLRVHRRCKDPMFSIANEIAYNGKMIHGSDDIEIQDEFIWGNSTWFDVPGELSGKHYVDRQGQFVLRLLEAYAEQYHRLPDCYIISPFKDVTRGLFNRLVNDFRSSRIDKISLNKWINSRIGTVHTFQGKEEKTVLVVLGASTEAMGAASWAASKPNLLNVAVTRAKDRVYFIGCSKVWGSLSFFSTAISKLPISRIRDHFKLI